MKEIRKRSLAKTISWRITATLTTMTIVYIFTGQITLSIGIGVFEVIAKMFLYYAHERIWHHIPWGKIKHPLESIPVNKELSPEDREFLIKKLKDLGYI